MDRIQAAVHDSDLDGLARFVERVPALHHSGVRILDFTLVFEEPAATIHVDAIVQWAKTVRRYRRDAGAREVYRFDVEWHHTLNNLRTIGNAVLLFLNATAGSQETSTIRDISHKIWKAWVRRRDELGQGGLAYWS